MNFSKGYQRVSYNSLNFLVLIVGTIVGLGIGAKLSEGKLISLRKDSLFNVSVTKVCYGIILVSS